MKRIKLKHNKSLINKLIIIVILLLVGILFGLNALDKKVSPVLLNYAELEVKRLSTLVVTKAISKHVTEDLDVDNMFEISKDSNENVNSVDYNPIVVNKFLTTVTSSIQLSLHEIEEGNITELELSDDVEVKYSKDKKNKGIIFWIPLGVVWENSLLSNLGPKIPVRLNVVGDITSNVNTKVTNYGINNALIEVSVNVKIDEQVILPFTSKKVTIENDVPVALKLVNGAVPNYYFKGLDSSSSVVAVPSS